ncbi:MAG: AAA family ATPase [bacterium]
MILGQAERLHELANLSKSSRTQKFSCPIIAFTSGKGGTGKTFVTINSAFLLTKLRRKILIVDLDANLSNVNIMLNIKPTASIYEFFNNSNTIDEIIYQYEPNLHFIFGESGKMDHPELTQQNIMHLFDSLRKISHNYDLIFLDTSSGAGEGVIAILSNSDYIFLVTNPEPTSIMDAYVIIKLLTKNTVHNKKFVIINRCNGFLEGKTAFDNLHKASSHFLKEQIELLGIVEYSSEVSKSILSQEPFSLKYPSSKVNQQLKNICKGIITLSKLNSEKY